MSQYVETPCKTFQSGSALGAHLRVKLTAGKLALAGSTDHELGTMDQAVLAADVQTAVRLRNAQGTQKFVAVEAITKGNPFYAAANGKVAASGTVLIGIALETTTTDGDVFEGLRRQETSDSAAAGGTTAAAFLVDSDATTPKIELAGQTAGTGDFKLTLKPPSTIASSSKTATFPDATGEVVIADAVQTITGKKRVVEAHTANDTLTAAESGSIHTSVGASGTITLILPAAAVGLEFMFRVGAAQQLRLDPNASETIALPSTGVQGGAGKYLVADAIGESVYIACDKAGEWTVYGFTGTWTAEP